MPLSELSASTQNYLKAIWSLEEWSNMPATASALAERMGLRASSVSDGLKRLAAADLIEHQRYGTIELTELGRTYAVAMIRRHRLIETFLVETLGYTWDRVHDEAEVLEHAVSDFMIERIDTVLGHPSRDPHGDPIPDASGRISFPHTVPLSQCEPGETVVLERINDSDPKLLRYLSEHGSLPVRTWRSKRAHRSPRPLMCVLSHQRMQALHPPKPLLLRHRPPCHWGQLPQPTFSSLAPKNRPTMRACYPCAAGLCCARWAARIRPSTP